MRLGSIVRFEPKGVALLMGLTVMAAGTAAAAAPAHRPRVAVVRAADGDGPLQEIATRIIAELMANGITVTALACVASEPDCLPDPDEGLLATVMVLRDPDWPAVEIRAHDAHDDDADEPDGTGAAAPRISRLVSEEGAGPRPAALAVRTVELVRALVVEPVDRRVARALEPVDDNEEPREMKVATAPPMLERRPPLRPWPPPRLSLSLGAAMIGSFSGLGMAFGPSLHARRQIAEHVALSVAGAGPAFGRDVGNAGGSVSVRQELAVARVDFTARLGSRFLSWAGAGGGVYHIAVDGHLPAGVLPVMTPPTTTAVSVGAFSSVLVWSAGLVGDIAPGVGLFLDAHLLLRTPTHIIRVSGDEVGRAGNPGMVVTSGVELRI